MGRAAELEAELAVIQLEDALGALKADPDASDDELRRVKYDLREARRTHRLLRDGVPAEDVLGDATVRPSTIETTAGVKQPGGK